MAAVVAPNASPAGVLRRLHGLITSAKSAYPDVLHVEIRSPEDGLWKLVTQDAEWHPTDPSQLIDKEVVRSELDEESGGLKLTLSDRSSFEVIPAEQEAADDPANWKLFTPESLVLVFGPGGRWHFNRADGPVALPVGPEALSGNISKAKMIALMTLAEEEMDSGGQRWASELLLKERALRNEHLVLALSAGISIISIAVAAVSLVFALR